MKRGNDLKIEFNSIEELYKRVYPALSAKTSELKRLGYKNIEEKNIWDFLSTAVFARTKNLTLADIVHEIMHVDINSLEKYINSKTRA